MIHLLALPLHAQVHPPADSAHVDSGAVVVVTHPEASTHSPTQALWRALAVPGWGQVYNRQFYKLPFVYAALGGITALAVSNVRRHRDARRAFLFAAGQDETPNPYQEFEPYYLDPRFNGATADRLFDYKNALRRSRDLSFFGVGVVYAISVLDAYINAHLFDFDVGEDLSLAPRLSPNGVVVALRVRL